MKNYPLHYRIAGRGATVVLLHGYMADGTYWDDIAATLSKQYRVIRVDLLGFGKSPKPVHSAYGLDDHVRAIEHTLKTIIGSEQFVLAGHSMGGIIASAYAVRWPEQIAKLILFNMPLFSGQAQARAEIAGTSQLYRAMLYSSFGSIAWPLLRAVLTVKTTHLLAAAPHRALLGSLCTNSRASRRRSLRNVIESTNGIAILKTLTVPTRLVMGERDRGVYKKNLAGADLSDAVSVSWVEAGHHVPLAQPDLVRKCIVGGYCG